MTAIRPTVKTSEWNISKHEFYAAYHYALQYNEWQDMVIAEATIDTPDPENQGLPKGNGTSDPTYIKALKITEYKDKIRMIEQTVKEAGEDIYLWLLKGVTNENCTYNYLSMRMNIPCGKNYYYDRRRRFYYLLSKKLEAK